MARMTWAQDAAKDDAGAHRLSRSHTQRRRRTGRRGRGLFRGHGGGGLGRGLLGGGLLSGIFALLAGLLGLGKRKKVARGHHARMRKGRRAKILRASAPRGIKRPVVRDQPRVASTGRKQLTFTTGVFNVTTRKLVRRRLLG